jgi:DNA invertase Pin-like site-specific DNA recombinase
MSRTFAYCRVSTLDQNNDNQILMIEKNGYKIEPHRVITEKVSGSVAALSRPQFKTLIEEKLEKGDTLVVLKLDRLGRDNIDLQKTIQTLTDKEIRVVSLDLPVQDLSSSEGKLMLQLFGAFAEFERNRIVERTQAGLDRAKVNGKKLGRPKAQKTTQKVQTLKAEGLTQKLVSERLGISLITVKRHWNV